MPELPEVEVLIQHLDPVLRGRVIHQVSIRRERVLRPTSVLAFKRALKGARFRRVSRRAKFLVFELISARGKPLVVLGHLGMTGRMYLQSKKAVLPRHAPVVLDIGRDHFVFEDTRYFGRLTLDTSSLNNLGPELLGEDFSPWRLGRALARSRQSIKVRLLDQTLVAGIGNIYASEALFLAGISPMTPAANLRAGQITRLFNSLRQVLKEAIQFGSTVPLDLLGGKKSDGLFHYGRSADHVEGSYEERLRVYDRQGLPCFKCQTPVQRIVQAARSTFFCRRCQK